MHALGRVLTRELERTAVYRDRVPRICKQTFTFLVVTLAWVFFRAESVGDAWLILKRIFTTGLGDPEFPIVMLAMILSVWVYQFLYESRLRAALQTAPVRIGLVVGMLVYVAVFAPSGGQAFIYFQF